MKIKATNDNVWIVRHPQQTEVGGILIPESAKIKVHKGDIVTVGELVSDKKIKEGSVAIFNKSAGFPIEEGGVEYTVLTQIDIVGIDASSK